jgi:hypothetical protein
MSPDKKLKWFKDHGRGRDVAAIKKLVVTRWNETYKGSAEPGPAAKLRPRGGKRGKVSTLCGCIFEVLK